MGYDEEKMRAIYDEEHKKEMKLEAIKDELLEDRDFFDQIRTMAIEDDDFMSTIMSSKYSKVEILRNKEGYIEVKGTIELPSDTLLVELKRKYPYSDIVVVNHNGITSKIEITEKIRFEK
ncbi:MAG: hypothetical protein PHH98_00220 [Candidatus Gracilibacteria bacterium]|nr:hypothetical protein [Candidatus Gracilibacteria bacterium]